MNNIQILVDGSTYEFTQQNIDDLLAVGIEVYKDSVAISSGTSIKLGYFEVKSIGDSTVLDGVNALTSSMTLSSYTKTNDYLWSKSHTTHSYKGLSIDYTLNAPTFDYNKITQDNLDYLTSKNSSMLVAGQPVEVGTIINIYDSIKFVSDSGFRFVSVDMTYYTTGGYDEFGDPLPPGTANESLRLSSDKTETINGQAQETTYNGFTIVNEVYIADTYELAQGDLDDFVTKGVILEIDGVQAVVGDNLGVNPLEFKADATHIISEAYATYTESEYDGFGDVVYVEYNTDLQVSTNAKSATGQLLDKAYDSITVVTVETEGPVIDNKNGFTNVYSLTNDDMVNVLENSLYQVNTGTETTTVDGVTYIQTLYNLPFELSENELSEKENVFLGEKDTGVNVDTLDGRDLYISGGEITVSGVGDLKDFTNKSVILHLPFFQPVQMEVEHVVGETLTIEYKINTFTGDCVVYISSTKTGGEVNQTSGKIGIEIPYKTAFIYSDAIKYGNESSEIQNDLKTAYIEIYDSTDTTAINSQFLTPILDNGVLSGVTGYVVVNDVELLTTGVNSEELNRIESLLKTGVKIND